MATHGPEQIALYMKGSGNQALQLKGAGTGNGKLEGICGVGL